MGLEQVRTSQPRDRIFSHEKDFTIPEVIHQTGIAPSSVQRFGWGAIEAMDQAIENKLYEAALAEDGQRIVAEMHECQDHMGG